MSAPRPLLDFFTEDGGLRRSSWRRAPLEVLLREAPRRGCYDVLRAVERPPPRAPGAWATVSYEAAVAFDPAFGGHAPDGPLAWFGVFDESARVAASAAGVHPTATGLG